MVVSSQANTTQLPRVVSLFNHLLDWLIPPAAAALADPNAVEVGVKFTTDVDGYISAIRYYQGAGNTGEHSVNLWTIDGTQLATATASAEAGTGWRQINLAEPVAIFANTVYVASYFAPNGHYANDNRFFLGAGFDSGHIHLLQNRAGEPNGVYAYSGTSTFPSSSYRSTNYWVDVVFITEWNGIN